MKNQSHNQSGTRLYYCWQHIKQRCLNSNDKGYVNYGLRGIEICDTWKESYIEFRDWAVENGYKEDLSIDRIDNNGNYEPSNCRWESKIIQNQNTRVLQKNNTSGYRGVTFSKRRKKWIAQITISRINKYIGQYDSAEEAAMAYNEFVINADSSHSLNLVGEDSLNEIIKFI